MTRLITLLIGFSFAFAALAQAKPAQEENPKNKKSKPVQQQQLAPNQRVAPKQQSVPKQQRPVPTDRGPKGPMKESQETMKKAHRDPALQDDARVHQKEPTKQNLTTLPQFQPNKPVIQSDRPAVQPNTLPAVKSNKLNKTVKSFQPRHRNFQARVNPSVASVRFNENFRIRNADNWKGHHYNAFRTYRPQWRDRSWWRSNHRHIVLIGGGWYYWNSGYWYPAWGYDDSAAYYPYDGPIYVGSSPRPFDQVVADVQSILQEQGYYRGEVDGLVGPLTQEALAAYQSAQGLEPTAAIDQPTLESLGVG